MEYLEVIEKVTNTDYTMSKPHTHEFYELYFSLKGTREIFCQNKVFSIPPKCFCVIPPFSMHKTEGGPYHRINVYISKSLLTTREIDFLNECEKNFSWQLDEKYYDIAISLLRSAVAIQSTNIINQDNYKLSLIKSLFYYLLNSELKPLVGYGKSPSRFSTDTLVLEIISFLHKNYASEINLQLLCDTFFVSKTTLCNRFRNYMHCSLFDYLSRLRINESTHLLIGTRKSIEEISEQCGFSSAKYFRQVFKKQLGISPCNFRKSKR